MEQYNYNQTAVLRDVQVAQEIRSMAALGKFPEEITAYGLAYYQDGARRYMLTTDQSKLIRFLNEPVNQQYFPTLIDGHTERLAIPEGFEADVVRAVKLTLAQTLQANYPSEAFALLVGLGQTEPNTCAEEALLESQRQLEGVFWAEKIRAFAALCTRAYLRKNCTLTTYQRLYAWCQKRLAQLDGYVPPLGAREKSFYGLAALKDGRIDRCVVNANLSCIHQEKLALEQQGYVTTIWHKMNFDVPKQESLNGITSQMTANLAAVYDESMLKLITAIEQAPAAVSSEQFQAVMTKLNALGEAAAALGRYYGRRFGLDSEEWREI